MNRYSCSVIMFLCLGATDSSGQVRKRTDDVEKTKASLVTEYLIPDGFTVSKSQITLVGPRPRSAVPDVVWVSDALIEFTVNMKLKGNWRKKPPEKAADATINLVIDIEQVCSVQRLLYRAKKSEIAVKDLNSDNVHKLVSDLFSAPLKKHETCLVQKKIRLAKNFPMDWVKIEFGALDFPASGRDKQQAMLYRFVVRENSKLKGFSQLPAYFVTSKSPDYVKNAKLAKSIVSGLSSFGFMDQTTRDFLVKVIDQWRNSNAPRQKKLR